jgi:hypothetical protein
MKFKIGRIEFEVGVSSALFIALILGLMAHTAFIQHAPGRASFGLVIIGFLFFRGVMMRRLEMRRATACQPYDHKE